MPERIVALDVGGTYVKHAVFEGGQLRADSAGQFPIDEKGTADDILSALYAYLDGARANIVCVSMPGPMDYINGVSRMRHKFAGLYGVQLRARFEARYAGARCIFTHDVVAYLAGVMHLGECEGARVPCGITLGTGLGFAFAERGQILINDARSPSFPLWNAPFRDGICEDYVSGRALGAEYARRAGERVDVKQIAERARAGDANALAAFADMGRALGDMIQDRARRFSIDRVVLGGQISKSADLFLPYARELTDKCISPTSHPDDAALYGAYALALNGEKRVCRAIEAALPYGEGS